MRFEYLKLQTDQSQDDLNVLGEQGWELISFRIEANAANSGASFLWLFKRRRN